MHDSRGLPVTFADIALALTLSAPKLQRDIERLIAVAEHIGLSQMGLEVSIVELKRDAMLVEMSVEIFKKLAEVEPQIRAVLERKVKRRWSDFARVAAI